MRNRLYLALSCACACMCLCAAALLGCSSSNVDVVGSRQGFAVDTELPQSPVELTIYADAYLTKRVGKGGGEFLAEIEERYRNNEGRDVVTFAPTNYVDADELLEAAASDPDADIVICTEELMGQALDEGLAEGGRAKTSVRQLNVLSYENLVVARKEGASVEMPDTRLVGGEDSPGGVENRFMRLGEFEGKIAICPESSYQGMSARAALATTGAGLYSEESGVGGTFANSVEGKLVDARDADDALGMLRDGTCDIALVYDWDLTGAQGVEELYQVGGGFWKARYQGASLIESPDGAVGRDFLQFLARAL